MYPPQVGDYFSNSAEINSTIVHNNTTDTFDQQETTVDPYLTALTICVIGWLIFCAFICTQSLPPTAGRRTTRTDWI